MDPMENLVRDVLREHASEAPTVVPEIRSHRRSTLWLVAGASAAAVVVFAASLMLLRRDDSGGGAAPPATTSTPDPARSAYVTPPDLRTVAYHQFTVDVPGDLPVLTVPCKLPERYVVEEDPHTQYDCVAGSDVERQTLTVRLSSASATWQDIAMHPDTVNGLAVDVGYGTADGYAGTAGQLTIGSGYDIGIMVTAPDRATVEQILESVRQQADPNGCSLTPDAFDNTPANSLLPPGAVSAVRCVYTQGPTDGEVLQASLPVRGFMFEEVIDAIGALPGAGADEGSAPPYEHDRLLVRYPDDTIRTLDVRLDAPTVYSDGTHRSADADSVVTDRLRAATNS